MTIVKNGIKYYKKHNIKPSKKILYKWSKKDPSGAFEYMKNKIINQLNIYLENAIIKGII